MQRITNIYIKNFKAYKDGVNISMPNGENLLLYGENGSGKSSLFSGIMYFFDKSNNFHLKPQVNIYSGSVASQVRLVFKDFVNGIEEEYYASESELPDDLKFSQFIKVSDLTKGFLDYRDLLSLYMNKEDNTNLFDVFIKLIGNMANPASRDTRTINQKFDSIYNKLKRIKIRRGKNYDDVIKNLLSIDNEIKSSLDLYFSTLNTFLNRYFPDLRVKLSYTISALKLPSRGQISNAKIQAELHLKVEKDGTPLKNYTHILNEARLSAIGICIYLSALKNSPQDIDYKILFLDDIFIGLDMGNRIPILNILEQEFTDYQIIISTYDRGWYNMARRIFNAGNIIKWKFVEVFAGEETLEDGRIITKPIITSGDSNLERARKYLHNQISFDYPASANYFRKCIEQLLTESFPKTIFRDDNDELLEKYKLTQILSRSLQFCKSIPGYVDSLPRVISDLTTLHGLLSSLLHPLSHYDPNSPVYRHELILIEDAVVHLSNFLPKVDFSLQKIKFRLQKGDFLKLTLGGKSGWNFEYRIKLEENLFSYIDVNENKKLSLAKCYVSKMSGIDEKGNILKPVNITKKSGLYTSVSYKGLEALVEGTINYLIKKGKVDLIKKDTLIEYLEYFKDAETTVDIASVW